MKTLLLILALAAAGDAGKILRDLESPDYLTRRKAVLACEGRPEPEILERLLVMAIGDGHPNIRGYVADVLPSFDDPRVFPLLVEMATAESRWPGPRHSALVALGRTGDARAYDLLVPHLAADRIEAAHAAKGLGLLGDARAYAPVLALYDSAPEDGWIGPMGVDALVLLDPAKAVEDLLQRFENAPAGALYSLAAALAEHAGPEIAPKLLPYLESEDEPRRLAAIRILGGAGGEIATDALLRHLAGTGKDVAAVARAIRDSGNARAAPELGRALAVEKSPETKMVLMEALAALGNRRAVEVIASSLGDETLVPQPMRMSSIGTFPLNTRVNGAAWWAIRTLLDGEPPVPIQDLSGFQGPPPAEKRIERGITELRRWWEENSTNTDFRFPPSKRPR